MNRNLLLLIPLALLVVGILVATQVLERAERKPETEAVILDQPRLIPDMILLDHHGTAWSPGRLEGQWSLVFFGFTHCPDICPETMVQMNQVHRRVEENGRVMPPSVIFVTVDPARDSHERLAEYVPYFNRHFLGLTGGEEAILSLAASMGVPVSIPDVAPDEDYEVDHGVSISLVDPEGHIRAFFTPPHRVESIADDYEAIVRYLRKR